ncbi:hypothetical protein B0A48_00468 [Cryoendolithus antarcticus]|uniref:Chromatin assembly factor 1 subunit A n=1 Tax=Cryoendolithus antarcticus TaxID=1507870 RepID=A0A1V8TUS7_9PEZI|nr:hypothetical protein B0A48_00468 [Cryoendolithus antarcticus]
MDDIVSSPAPEKGRKRSATDEDSPARIPLNLKGTQFMMPSPPDTGDSADGSPTVDQTDSRDVSPTPSSSALSSIMDSSITQEASTATTVSSTALSSTGPPPAKRRKLSPTEKLEQARLKQAKAAEKEAKAAERAEDKKVKEEEKRVKDEEKRVRDEERRQKAEEKEAKRREKDLEEERKVQEKMKKERAQMRLGAFFQKPATPSGTAINDPDLDDTFVRARRRSVSLGTYDEVADQIGTASPVKLTPTQSKAATPLRPAKPGVSDYRRHFLPFDIQNHTTLARPLTGPRDSSSVQQDQEIFDQSLADPSLQEKYDLGLVDSYASVVDLFSSGSSRARGLPQEPVRRVFERLHGNSTQQPVDLTNDATPSNPLQVLQSLPRRYLHFDEDVRPAYFGTYTKPYSPRSIKRLCRDPFTRGRKDTEYDYDSENEWEEPEEGEDILGDEEDEAESTGDADEMEGFLDDENDELKNSRKYITSDLAPVSTGLCWEDKSRNIIQSTERHDEASDMTGMQLHVLIPGFTGCTIDPFCTTYWTKEVMPPPTLPAREPGANAFSQLSRPPLKERQNSSNGNLPGLVGAAEGEKGPINSSASTAPSSTGEKRGRKPAPRTLSREDLDEFKDAVVGSQLGKAELCKALKMRFPKIPNEVIKETLGSRFAQVGTKREDKVWRFVAVD